ncbi:hypothetical protein [Brachybacterium fresconis]|uniref:PD-(D/E)XK motif protein n=2 Tax=Brachybacterium fresconis TaxID=173363 RepID=A0ABS4YN37_9MICO|nr:hypothetical protein [Brachybacterium fresconis]
MNGLGRILASETNVSDLLAYFTEEDPTPWAGLIGSTPARVTREGRARSENRADLLLMGASGETIGAVEVKLGHHLSPKQSEWYTSTFGAEVTLLLASLDPVSPRDEHPDSRWSANLLPDLVSRWKGSSNSEVSVLAAAAERVLSEWSALITSVSTGSKGKDAEPVESISDPFLGRILTRALKPAVLEGSAESAYPGVTSGGGNALLQAWRAFPGKPDRHDAITEVRWQPSRRIMDFRFGVDVTKGGRAGREAAWELATTLDSAIRVDSFSAYLEGVDQARAGLLSSARGTGRPTKKGNWADIVEKGFRHGDASQYNPGFYRDGDRRFEASARIDTSRATGPDLVALLDHALVYLTEQLSVK